MSLTACSQGIGKPNVQILPDVKEFTKEEQKQAAEELKRNRADMPVITEKILPACKVMRDQTRAAHKLLKKGK